MGARTDSGGGGCSTSLEPVSTTPTIEVRWVPTSGKEIFYQVTGFWAGWAKLAKRRSGSSVVVGRPGKMPTKAAPIHQNQPKRTYGRVWIGVSANAQGWFGWMPGCRVLGGPDQCSSRSFVRFVGRFNGGHSAGSCFWCCSRLFCFPLFYVLAVARPLAAHATRRAYHLRSFHISHIH